MSRDCKSSSESYTPTRKASSVFSCRSTPERTSRSSSDDHSVMSASSSKFMANSRRSFIMCRGQLRDLRSSAEPAQHTFISRQRVNCETMPTQERACGVIPQTSWTHGRAARAARSVAVAINTSSNSRQSRMRPRRCASRWRMAARAPSLRAMRRARFSARDDARASRALVACPAAAMRDLRRGAARPLKNCNPTAPNQGEVVRRWHA